MLKVLDQKIDTRCRALIDARPDWPCRSGCDHCCRHLAEPLLMTLAEWQRLEEGWQALDAAARADVEARLEDLARQEPSAGPYVCPFLHLEKGTCQVYQHRPIACRTYGFYRDRAEGRYCHLISEWLVEASDEAVETDAKMQRVEDLVWGNHQTIEEQLERECGEPLNAAEYLASRAPRVSPLSGE